MEGKIIFIRTYAYDEVASVVLNVTGEEAEAAFRSSPDELSGPISPKLLKLKEDTDTSLQARPSIYEYDLHNGEVKELIRTKPFWVEIFCSEEVEEGGVPSNKPSGFPVEWSDHRRGWVGYIQDVRELMEAITKTAVEDGLDVRLQAGSGPKYGDPEILVELTPSKSEDEDA
jgi:hypothetical protein